jgi:hypothetical protein
LGFEGLSIRHIKKEELIMSRKVMSDVDFNRLSRNELYRLSTLVVYAIRRLNKRLNEEEAKMKNKNNKKKQ